MQVFVSLITTSLRTSRSSSVSLNAATWTLKYHAIVDTGVWGSGFDSVDTVLVVQ